MTPQDKILYTTNEYGHKLYTIDKVHAVLVAPFACRKMLGTAIGDNKVIFKTVDDLYYKWEDLQDWLNNE